MQHRSEASAARRMKAVARNRARAPVLKTLRRSKRLLGMKTPGTEGYAAVSLTEQDIERGEYKRYIGGEGEEWELRGAFQLHFLQQLGMTRDSSLLEVGCGPGRASRFLIDFLDPGSFRGIDYNPDFIKAVESISQQSGLDAKHPVFEVVQDFDFQHIQPVYDYALLFSVLNHCRHPQRLAFFRSIHIPVKPGGRIYISHAGWFDESYVPTETLALTRRYTGADFDLGKFDWGRDVRVWPIIELTRR